MTTSTINYFQFPDVNNADEDGLLAMGGDLTVDTLVSAYKQGIFPWFNDDQPILWWSPDPRLVLFPSQIKVSKSLKKLIRQNKFSVTANQAFDEVIQACAGTRLNTDDSGTWICNSMQEAYCELNQKGYAHSVEAWQEGKLVGGLYGIALGNVFFGESMFSYASNASKVALVTLCNQLDSLGFTVIDCQVSSSHLLSLGAEEIDRDLFLEHLSDIDIHQTRTINF